MMTKRIIFILPLFLSVVACQTNQTAPTHQEPKALYAAQGKLFIIGGGKRPPELISRLCAEAGVDSTQGYVTILPHSSSEPDSAVWYAQRQFLALGIAALGYPWDSASMATPAKLDSLRQCPLIYISGGDQNRFMASVAGTGVAEAIHTAYQQGSTIAGTSAGAAVMSDPMITGTELKHPDYESTFRNLEAGNIELAPGLGLLPGVLIDQHFIKRSRYNRLLSAAMERPELMGIGIDESTALLVQGTQVEVVGESQVILFRAPDSPATVQNGQLGQRGLQLDVLLPGQTFTLLP